MVLDTLCSTGELMLQKEMSFEDVVRRVATKGGITEAGACVIYDEFPDTADAMFGKTLAKRRETASIGQTSDKRWEEDARQEMKEIEHAAIAHKLCGCSYFYHFTLLRIRSNIKIKTKGRKYDVNAVYFCKCTKYTALTLK